MAVPRCNTSPPCSPTELGWHSSRSWCWWSRKDGTTRRIQEPVTDSRCPQHTVQPTLPLLSPIWPVCRSPRRCCRRWRNPVCLPSPPADCCPRIPTGRLLRKEHNNKANCKQVRLFVYWRRITLPPALGHFRAFTKHAHYINIKHTPKVSLFGIVS